MRLLLDTHVLLWWLENPSRLSTKARRSIKDGSNMVYVSAAAIWEVIIKKSLGKLEIPNNLEDVLLDNRFLQLPITVSHALALEALPPYHRDPFDRMLIAQAIHENLTLVTRDPNILKYSVPHVIA